MHQIKNINASARAAAVCAAMLAASQLAACISTDSPLLQAGEGCEEFQPGAQIDNANVDPTVLRYMQAASSFAAASAALKGDVLTACSNIAHDLGAEDTWSALGDVDAAVSNAEGTGACNAAARLIEERLIAAGTVTANVALTVSRGQCHYDFEAQARCDAECAANPTCDAGTVETRCTPGSLSVLCSASCAAGSICEGRPDLPANCMGQCESTCQGECRGTCIAPDGKLTENDPNCQGKCSSSCNGTCRGVCRIDAPEGVSCGTSVRCTGECSGTFTEPECTSTFTPPTCTVDDSCYKACSAQVAASAVCDPSTVEIFADLTIAPELEPVVRTLEANLPTLIDAAQQRGQVLLAATRELAATGEELNGRIDDLDGHSLACVGASSTSLAEALGHFDVCASASVDITAKVEVNTL